MYLYLIRHGQSHVNLESWNNGNTDEGLTELGKQQAAALAEWLPQEVPDVHAIYASTMRRARETAEAVAGAYEASIVFDDRLREIGNNRLDHSPWPNDALPPEYADFWSSERPFAPVTPGVDGGETMMHFRTRVGLFIEEMTQRHTNEIIVAVCHGGVIEIAFDHIFNVGAFRHCEVHTHNTGVTCLQYVNHPRREAWRLIYHNNIAHLQGLAQPQEEKETAAA
ncbi:MAG: histidine phosphatase family protein [Chloroflexota bacterium]